MDGYFFSPSTNGFYHRDINADIPADAVPITAAEHAAFLSAQAAGAEIAAGDGGAPIVAVPHVDLDTLKTTVKRAIDAAAERERMRHVTSGAGQAMTYQRKAEEARACLVATNPVPAEYPMLAAEIGITAATLEGVAQVVNAAYEVWLSIGAQIEAARLSAKNAINAAQTAEEAKAAAEAVVWPEN
ncbi:hypothetical protein J5N58_16665 [Rhizobium cremeum]|uniref:hypothetical protein n=1 Tax=Rhizobium cremeum TaxID=2813827 RepID=UPI001FD31266|nr:hypothetical protein [Rhizobium cremeum]MCJ7996052.1 hypothetical protein [Rhizobium cremeum]MCJ8001311.1 hypothetical protein [Rhizobium cremeum]